MEDEWIDRWTLISHYSKQAAAWQLNVLYSALNDHRTHVHMRVCVSVCAL